MQKGLYSLEWGPGAEYTNAQSSLVIAKCLESGLNLMELMFLFVRNLWRIDLDIREIKIISPSSFAATKLKSINLEIFVKNQYINLDEKEMLPDSIGG